MLHSEGKPIISEAMECPAMDVDCALKKTSLDSDTDQAVAQQWSGCGHYFHKSLARRALLHTLGQKPSQA
jgi:hypothetical protein